MLLSISQIGLGDWMFAFMMGISFLIGIFGIPTVIIIFKTGRKNYFNQLRLLIKIKKGLNLCYSIDSYQKYNYIYPNGQTKVHGFNETNYYYPIFESDTKLTMVQKRKGPFNKIHIVENTKVGGDDTPWSWNSDTHELKTISCIFLQLLNDRVQKKMDKLSDNPIQYEDVSKLSDFINSELTSIKRETVLKSLLNE
jgi:hypothetical protein